MTTERTRPSLENIAQDDTAPRPLRDALRHALRAYDEITALYDEAADSARLASDTLSSRRADEARRLLLRALEHRTPALTDVLPGYEALIEQERVYKDRLSAVRRGRHTAWQYACSGVFAEHADAVLNWAANTRAAEPWTRPLPEHIADAWNRVAGRFTFQTPMVARSHRYSRLLLQPATDAMRRTWAAIHAGDVTLVDTRPGMTTYRVTAYWPDLAEEPALA